MAPPDAHRDGSTPGGKLGAALTSHPGYKLSALFFATVIWVVVSAEEPAERLVRVEFAPAVDGGVRLVEPPELRALVAGPAREILKLYESPPVVRRPIGAEEAGEVRVAIVPADVELPPGVDVVVRDVRPRTFTVRVARASHGQPTRARGP